MLRNYLRIAWRNLWKNRFYSTLNMTGLAIGMAVCIVIMLFVFNEKSFDKLHTKNIYRLDEVQKFPGMVAPQKVALSMFPMAPTLKQEFPEIKNFTRIYAMKQPNLRYNGKKVRLDNLLWADSTFLDVFDYPLPQGDRNTALDKPNSMVLSRAGAAKIFGNESAIGQTLTIEGRDTVSYTITGILENIPANSHLQFDGLISFNTRSNIAQLMNNWGGNWVNSYLELAPQTDVAALEKKFPAYLKRHMDPEGASHYELFLQSLSEVHAGSTDITHDYNNFSKFDSTYTYLFSIIAIIVLTIACINFMNLSTARSTGRAKEVGVRKSIGALRGQLAFQFIGESVLLCLISLVIALVLVKLSLPYVAALSQRDIDVPVFTNGTLLLSALGCAVAVGILSGLYPAVILSAFQPTQVLKGTLTAGKDKSLFRNILVVGQFTGAIVLIIGTVFALRQLRFMQKKDPGFITDQVLTIPLNFKTAPNYDAIKTALLNNTLITGVTGSGQRLGNNLHQTGITYHGKGPARNLATSQVIVDPDYLSVYKIQIVAGRNFTKEVSDNGQTYIVNESMAHELLKDDPKAPLESLIGKHFGFNGMDSAGQIVGVAKDFNFNSLHHKIETLTIFNQKDWGYAELSVSINGAQAKKAIEYISTTWQQINPGQDFEYQFLNEHFSELYKADQQVSEIVGILAGLAIVISCLGLFGLASYTAERRIKEIGIRKVLGASTQNIVGMLSGSFLRLVLVANLIAWPLAWLMLSKWLQSFAYRVDISWWVFVMAGIAALLIALITVSFQALKAAIMNPVKSLRSE